MFGAAVRQHQTGRLQDAERLYRKILSVDPAHVGSLHLLGVLAHQTGLHQEAEKLIGRAIALNGAIPEVHYHMGMVQNALGRPDAAAEHLRRAIALNPNHADAHLDLGATLRGQRRGAEAEASYRAAIRLRPDSPNGHYNLANLLAEHGRLAEAVESFQRALTIAPTAAFIHNNLGSALMAQHNFIGAVTEFQHAIRCDPTLAQARRNLAHALSQLLARIEAEASADAKSLFVFCVENLTIIPEEIDLRTPTIRAIAEPWGRPSDLLRFCGALIRAQPDIGAAIERVTASWPRRLPSAALLGTAGRAALIGDMLLRVLLESTRLTDVGLERLLTNVRALLLDEALAHPAADARESAQQREQDDGELAFQAALAQQCFLNDYVYGIDESEAKRADALRARLAAALRDGDSVPATWVACVGAYSRLGSLPHAEALLDRPWPTPIAALLRQQIAEPAEEQTLRAAVPALTAIDDGMSDLVRQQYEENPYPRWVKLPIDRPFRSLGEYVRAIFPRAPLGPLADESGGILIAGCGTGQQPLDTAIRLPGSRILAVDLSLASLAYAKRKAQALGIGNVAFAQADILALGSLGRTFTAIEATGVLHHLADPWAGWAILLSLLAPGGVMRIGLYSEIARQPVVAARQAIVERRLRPTAEDIRRLRQEALAPGADSRLGIMQGWSDFFSISECRDLLFHVQEQHMSLPDIKEFLADHGLTFLGFELAEAAARGYAARFPADAAKTDLDCWHQFETAHPHTFTGMYEFWVQKPAASDI